MACEFTCSDCGGDGTRCDCHKKRYNVGPRQKTNQELIAENDAKIAHYMWQLRTGNF
jgi:hypothetical protein